MTWTCIISPKFPRKPAMPNHHITHTFPSIDPPFIVRVLIQTKPHTCDARDEKNREVLEAKKNKNNDSNSPPNATYIAHAQSKCKPLSLTRLTEVGSEESSKAETESAADESVCGVGGLDSRLGSCWGGWCG